MDQEYSRAMQRKGLRPPRHLGVIAIAQSPTLQQFTYFDLKFAEIRKHQITSFGGTYTKIGTIKSKIIFSMKIK